MGRTKSEMVKGHFIQAKYFAKFEMKYLLDQSAACLVTWRNPRTAVWAGWTTAGWMTAG